MCCFQHALKGDRQPGLMYTEEGDKEWRKGDRLRRVEVGLQGAGHNLVEPSQITAKLQNTSRSQQWNEQQTGAREKKTKMQNRTKAKKQQAGQGRHALAERNTAASSEVATEQAESPSMKKISRQTAR